MFQLPPDTSNPEIKEDKNEEDQEQPDQTN